MVPFLFFTYICIKGNLAMIYDESTNTFINDLLGKKDKLMKININKGYRCLLCNCLNMAFAHKQVCCDYILAQFDSI